MKLYKYYIYIYLIMKFKYNNIVKKHLLLYYIIYNVSIDIYNNILSYIEEDDQKLYLNIIKYNARNVLIYMIPSLYVKNINIINVCDDDIIYIIKYYNGYPIIYNSYILYFPLFNEKILNKYERQNIIYLNNYSHTNSKNILSKLKNTNKYKKNKIKNNFIDDILDDIVFPSKCIS